jgi:hypothetical protein
MSRKSYLALMAVASTWSTSGRKLARANGTDKESGAGKRLLTLCGIGDLDGVPKANAHFSPAAPSRGCLRRLRISKVFSTRPQTPQRGMATPSICCQGRWRGGGLRSFRVCSPPVRRFSKYIPKLHNHSRMDVWPADGASRRHRVKNGGGENRTPSIHHIHPHIRDLHVNRATALPFERGTTSGEAP